MVALQTRISPGLLVARKPSPVFTTTAPTELRRRNTGDLAYTFRHQTRYCFSYAWPSAWQRGETHNNESTSRLSTGVSRVDACWSAFKLPLAILWGGTLQLASASKTFLFITGGSTTRTSLARTAWHLSRKQGPGFKRPARRLAEESRGVE